MLKFLFLFFLFTSSPIIAQHSGLRKSIKTFNTTVAQPSLPESEYYKRLSLLIDPEANVDSLTNDYYSHWKKSRTKSSFPSKVKIKKIDKQSKVKATITTHCIWFDLEYGTYLYVSQSVWLKKNGQWYRSGIPEKLVSSKKMKSS